jgi:hypothetical protein
MEAIRSNLKSTEAFRTMILFSADVDCCLNEENFRRGGRCQIRSVISFLVYKAHFSINPFEN